MVEALTVAAPKTTVNGAVSGKIPAYGQFFAVVVPQAENEAKWYEGPGPDGIPIWRASAVRVTLPAMSTGHSFNPLDRVELGRSVGRALLLSECGPLPPEPFAGAGIYAIYYQGDFDAYAPLAIPGCVWPIYVGRAMPSGGRKGLVGLDASPGPKLHARLREHAKSLDAATNLKRDHFRCRYLVVDDIWIPLAERLLIGHYRPVWNGVVDGFGIHDPGGKPGGRTGRAGQMKSLWDTLHPGRAFADGREEKASVEEIRDRIAEHLFEHPPRDEEMPVLGEPPASDEEVGEEDDA
ncbi:MAG TPA: Eco29kI family restriction endonuclease [Capillimicrobium sp.]|nr:Eco29kI family restriction endonuclease [Capillimicrobium sp.]